MYNRRSDIVERRIADYLRSPSLRQIRDPRSIARLSAEILRELDADLGIWRKWDGPRQELMSSAVECWIPVDDLHAFLNELPGPLLTRTDVEERLHHLIEVEAWGRPEDKLQDECLRIYAEEKAQGTELPAIVARISRYVGSQFVRLRQERRDAEQGRLDAARAERERRLLSAADCPWTQMRGSRCLYTRKNGRLYRLQPNRDKTLWLDRVEHVDDAATGVQIGRYSSRGQASKVLARVAFEPE
jgi:hypothetical protein